LTFAVLISCVYGLITDSDFIFLTLGYASATANIYGDNHAAQRNPLTESQRAIAN
jgi:hypothetical protein